MLSYIQRYVQLLIKSPNLWLTIFYRLESILQSKYFFVARSSELLTDLFKWPIFIGQSTK